MISVQNHLQQLSGSKNLLYLVVLAFFLQGCKAKKLIPPPPVNVEEGVDSKDTPTEPVVLKPAGEPIKVEPIKTEPVDVSVPTTEPLDTVKKATPVLIKEQVDLAVILPFKLDELDAGKLSSASKNSLNIYKGIKYALQEQNFSDKELNVYVFDNKGSESETQRILTQHPFPNVDAVIGPLYGKNVKVVSNFAKTNKVPFISPLSSSEKLAVGNPYIVSANATKPTRYNQLLKYLKSELINPNVSVIYQPVKNDTKIKDQLVKLAAENKLILKEQISQGREMFSVAQNVLEKGRENVIILPTDDNNEGKLYMERMLQYLNSLSVNYSINVAALSEWNGVDGFDMNNYPGVNFLILDRYFVNELDVATNSKINQLKAQNNGVDLHIYTLQGYDIMNHLGQLIQAYGDEFSGNLSNPYQGLQTAYNFKDFNKNGQKMFVENKSINILKYQNGRWVKVN